MSHKNHRRKNKQQDSYHPSPHDLKGADKFNFVVEVSYGGKRRGALLKKGLRTMTHRRARRRVKQGLKEEI